jgi:hypothetical protein
MSKMSEPEKVARVFSALLQADLGSTVEEIVGDNNRHPDDNAPACRWWWGACASHDYCDANVYMGAAFALTGNDADDTGLWSAAWGNAKENGFYLDNLIPEDV